MSNTEWIWYDGRLVPWEQATVHVGAHALHYGTSVFEGLRAYALPGGSAIFCLEQHLDRMWGSAKVLRMPIPFSRDEIRQAILDTVRANGRPACYIRPIIFRGWGSIAVDPRPCPVHASILVLEMGKYLGPEAVERGLEVGVSSWRRMAPDTYPAAAKIGGQYVNSVLIVMEALDRGFQEGIALDTSGNLSEGSGENLFLVRGGEIFTPSFIVSILEGITRRCVMTLAADLGLPVHQVPIPRELLYLVDEAFFCGTAAEITPIRAVDGIEIGTGRRGPVTARLSAAFFDLVEGRIPDRHGWLTPVPGL